MFSNKEKRLKYLGFDDRWFLIIGVLVLCLSTVFIFNVDTAQLTTIELLITLLASLFYSTCDWLINRSILISLRKKYPSLKQSRKRIVLLLLGTTITVVFVDFMGIKLITFFAENVHYNFLERVRPLVVIVFLTAMVMAIYEAIYFFVLLKNSVREEEQAKQAIIQAQLDSLRNQAQPHFFFNTLNTLRDIIEQNSKNEAKLFVDKLSDIYRFLLESSSTNLVTLNAELKFAKAYIHVQSERFGENLKVNWEIPESYYDKLIAPMSLQLLLENAIKHNVVSRYKPLVVNVYLLQNSIVVQNKIQKKSTQFPSTQMGLKNIQKRYSLITNKTVIIENNLEEFIVTLPLLTKSELSK
ncbi:MAG: histidine kinase [Bacteroidia bacterium]